ncbi:hypothetical protein JOC24_005314 [Streptomyces sp. HB132]|nr:hypothetical protein [Streptomyces sp. HB132]
MKPIDAASPRNRLLALVTVALTGSLALTGCDSLDELPDPTRSEAAPAPGGSALQAAEGLTVKGRAPKTGYDRDEFGSAWVDTDRNGCGTRVISMLRAAMGLFSQRMQGVVGCA